MANPEEPLHFLGLVKTHQNQPTENSLDENFTFQVLKVQRLAFFCRRAMMCSKLLAVELIIQQSMKHWRLGGGSMKNYSVMWEL